MVMQFPFDVMFLLPNVYSKRRTSAVRKVDRSEYLILACRTAPKVHVQHNFSFDSVNTKAWQLRFSYGQGDYGPLLSLLTTFIFAQPGSFCTAEKEAQQNINVQHLAALRV